MKDKLYIKKMHLTSNHEKFAKTYTDLNMHYLNMIISKDKKIKTI